MLILGSSVFSSQVPSKNKWVWLLNNFFIFTNISEYVLCLSLLINSTNFSNLLKYSPLFENFIIYSFLKDIQFTLSIFLLASSFSLFNSFFLFFNTLVFEPNRAWQSKVDLPTYFRGVSIE